MISCHDVSNNLIFPNAEVSCRASEVTMTTGTSKFNASPDHVADEGTNTAGANAPWPRSGRMRPRSHSQRPVAGSHNFKNNFLCIRLHFKESYLR